MKKWLHKTLVVSVAFLTLGLITPNHEIWSTFELQDKTAFSAPKPVNELSSALQLDDFVIEEQQSEVRVEDFMLAAREQSYMKFGSRVGPVIEQEFERIIFPQMERAIEQTLSELEGDKLRVLAVSERPSGQYSEKIFHITDTAANEDIIRFHVRTENRPFDGYYYNFHYHTVADQYVVHHDLGEIYWSKNQPPKWLS
ncbi:MAG: YpjP family protein [Solibacillus sp.]